MKDRNLHLDIPFPAAGATLNTGTLDIGVDVAGFSDQWRVGRLSLTIPALPNNQSNVAPITISLFDSGDGGLTFAATQPNIIATIAGIAVTGSPAQIIDMPLPPGLRGPFQLQVAVPAANGNNTAVLASGDWESQ